MSIKFYFWDGSSQVLKPTASFISFEERETKWNNGKRITRLLTLNERVAKIAADLGAYKFEIN